MTEGGNMRTRSDQNMPTWIILVAVVGILFEISFNSESLIMLGISALLIYFGWKKTIGPPVLFLSLLVFQ